MNVTYTIEEAQAAIQLYDMAVKSGGLGVAEAALVLTKKLQVAMAPEKETNDSSRTE